MVATGHFLLQGYMAVQRAHCAVVDGQTSPPFEFNHIFTLQVGLTDYKDHMGTNLSPEVDQWVGDGEHR